MTRSPPNAEKMGTDPLMAHPQANGADGTSCSTRALPPPQQVVHLDHIGGNINNLLIPGTERTAGRSDEQT